MSRIGKQPVTLLKGVKIQLKDNLVQIEGPKGKLELRIPTGIKVEVVGESVKVSRDSQLKPVKSAHGAIRALLRNMVQGVSQGYKRELDIVGVGYKAMLKGKNLVLNIGFANPVEVDVPADIKITTPVPTHIVLEGNDKQRVGELAAKIRRLFPPEPYKGKGIRYTGEEVRKKLGKALAK